MVHDSPLKKGREQPARPGTGSRSIEADYRRPMTRPRSTRRTASPDLMAEKARRKSPRRRDGLLVASLLIAGVPLLHRDRLLETVTSETSL